MTKKRMIAVIMLGVFLLFCCATVINYMSASEFVYDDLRTFWNSLNYIVEDIQEFGADSPTVHRRINQSSPKYATFAKPAYGYVMLDSQGNVLFRSESGIWWQDYDGSETKYVSLEPFLRDDVRKELLKFQNENKDRYLIMRELKVHFNGKEYYPVSFVLDNQSKELRTFILSDFQVTETILESQANLYYEFYDLNKNSIDHKYFLKVQEKLDNEIENFVFNTNNSGGGGSFGGGSMDWHDKGDDYVFYYFIEYSEFYETITSNDFYAMTVYSLVLFGAASLLIIIAAVKLYNKNKRMNEAKRAFTSATAHELKTPLTVIQNRCECVIENIAPEKNEEYIKSIYDEALRMNGMVQSLLMFNRLSDAIKIQKEKINLSQTVNAEIEKYSDFAESLGANLTAEIEENVWAVCNEELIAMAVDNYLSNAVKHARGDKNVKAVLSKKGNEFKFSVYNDSESVISISNSVWELLTREDEARNSADNSTGMGLPICRHVFRLHGYKHWFETEPYQISFHFSGKTV